MPKKQIIAVDIDEVLSPLHDLFFAHHNEKYGTHYPIRDVGGSYYITDYSGDSHDEAMRKIKQFVTSPEFAKVEPLEGATKVIEHLSAKYDLAIVTSRQDFYVDLTHRWLEKHFKGKFKHIFFTEYISGEGVKIPKSEFCLRIGASYMIEDNLEHAIECAAAGIEVLLFGDYPWNNAKNLPDRVTRVVDWQAVREYFDDQWS
jgi:5'(3')-deoxyribonucleotidase